MMQLVATALLGAFGRKKAERALWKLSLCE
jgi:hypothetical protein